MVILSADTRVLCSSLALLLIVQLQSSQCGFLLSGGQLQIHRKMLSVKKKTLLKEDFENPICDLHMWSINLKWS